MRAFVLWVLALGLVASPAMARTGDGPGDKATGATESAKTSTNSTPAQPEPSSVESELQQLRTLLESQNKQLQSQQQRMEALENQLRAEEAARANSAVSSPATSVEVSNAPAGPARAAENPDEPTAIHYKGITITPGGFMAAESVYRSRATASDVNTPFNSVPLLGQSQSQTSEFFASGRQSRISMLAQGKLAHATIGGYYEMDFLSSGTTSNNNQSNSYTLRQRQFWAQAKLDSGWTFTGGQMWSLLTETKKGLDNRSEALPMTIDAQYTVGFSWARQFGFRVVKSFNNKFWLGASVEESQINSPGVHGQNTNFIIGSAGTGGGLYNATANYAFNPSPDFVVKAAFEPGFGHYEVFGVLSDFRDRVFPCAVVSASCPVSTAAGAFNNSREGGGVGANARVSLVNKHLDVGVHLFAGDGIGRYGTGGLADVTVRPNGTLAPLREAQMLGTVEWHGTKLDLYFNVGNEYAARGSYKTAAGVVEGYGNPLFNNAGCNTEVLPGSGGFAPGTPGSCTGDIRNLLEGSTGFWYRFYKGPKGTIQFGTQYSYVVRNSWSGSNNGATAGVSPHGIDNLFFTSFRYYLP